MTNRPLPQSATPQQIEEYEERAAIKEFCGNKSRAQAEREAFEEIFLKKKSGHS